MYFRGMKRVGQAEVGWEEEASVGSHWEAEAGDGNKSQVCTPVMSVER